MGELNKPNNRRAFAHIVSGIRLPDVTSGADPIAGSSGIHHGTLGDSFAIVYGLGPRRGERRSN